MPIIPPDAAKLVKGLPFGTVIPTRAQRPLPDTDARHAALERFRLYLSFLVFSRTNAPGMPPEAFKVPLENITEEQPDPAKTLVFPSIGIIPAVGQHDMTSLGLGPPQPIESSYNKYGQDTVLLDQGEYVEVFVLEPMGSKKAERRALVAGLKVALRPLEETGDLRLTLPDYFDRIAVFTLNTTQPIDDPDVVRGRRRALMAIELRVQEVVLVDAVTLKPIVAVDVQETPLDEVLPAG